MSQKELQSNCSKDLLTYTVPPKCVLHNYTSLSILSLMVTFTCKPINSTGRLELWLSTQVHLLSMQAVIPSRGRKREEEGEGGGERERGVGERKSAPQLCLLLLVISAHKSTPWA